MTHAVSFGTWRASNALQVDPPPNDFHSQHLDHQQLPSGSCAFRSHTRSYGGLHQHQFFTLFMFPETEGSPGFFQYNRPSTVVSNIVAISAMLDPRLPVSPPESNSTWTLDFYGPSLSCSPVNATLHAAITKNALDMQNSCDGLAEDSPAVAYLSWLSAPGASLPYMNIASCELSDIHTKDLVNNGSLPLSVSLAVFPDSAKHTEDSLDYLKNSTIINCQLQNSSYDAIFNFTNGE